MYKHKKSNYLYALISKPYAAFKSFMNYFFMIKWLFENLIS